MRSCNERTILHCLESYLYYVILVNKKIFSEEWNEGEKKIDNISGTWFMLSDGKKQ
jgi:hypothetical protein